MSSAAPVVLERAGLDLLLEELARRDYRVIGPTPRDGAVSLDEIRSTRDFPEGLLDRQEPGSYHLGPGTAGELFGGGLSPVSPKRYLHPPTLVLWRARKSAGRIEIEDANGEPPAQAFFGVRPCDVAAIRIQDRVFLDGPFRDRAYAARRERCFVAVVNCTRPGGTCFCASIGTGPRAQDGFDIALTELGGAFLAEAGSALGAEVLAVTPQRAATPEEQTAAAEALALAARQMGRSLDTDGLQQALSRSSEHPRWDEVAGRCHACANCTLVCPTCFCTTVEDVTDLSGERAERVRRWDSCFTLDFSYIHGGSVRTSVAARYRQWITHKLSTWQDQFGSLGCVGCGRCITWCPAGIDITAEAAAIRAVAPQVPTGSPGAETGGARAD